MNKLLSRKFLAAVVTVIASMLVAFGVIEDASEIQKIAAQVIAGLVAVGWIASEAAVDAANKKEDQ